MHMQELYEQERALQDRCDEAVRAGSVPGLEVLDVEFDAPANTVRVFVDHPDGVDHELCARATTLLRDVCPDYALEVSSPGIDRPLRRAEHFRRAAGTPARVRLRGSKRPRAVIILGTEGDTAVLVEQPDGARETIALTSIARAHLDVASTALAPKPKPGQRAGSTTGRKQS
jgi:ribosome maturation factor RimP